MKKKVVDASDTLAGFSWLQDESQPWRETSYA